MSQALDKQSADYIFEITDAVSDKEGVDTLDLPPLYDYIDPAAFNQIIESGSKDLRIQFEYIGYQVKVDGEGSVTVIEKPTSRLLN